VLGFAFMHPLSPTLPTALPATLPAVDVTTAPRWQVRNMHLHTQHPLELTEFLQGMGVGGPGDVAGFEAMFPEWASFLEWMVANGQNEVEWILLEAASFAEFAQSPDRQDRLRRIVDVCHDWGVACGVDAPIIFQQQHTWRLIRDLGDRAVESAQLRERVDWLMEAGFDFLGTESGSTEFTNPGAERMLSWMDELAIYLDETYDKEVMIKVHCSTGQTAEPFVDRTTGEPLNFNFLPTYADRRMGVMPHTVQIYGLDDPAPTYGNTDFGYIRDFLQEEAGKRLVVWYPETAYWVSYDVDVPLFLPVYAERRVADLQLLADDEDLGLMGRGAEAGAHMDGQVIFSSGWEWGYWLNDVVAARASWDPFQGGNTPAESMRNILAPLARVLGDSGAAIVDEVVDLASVQRAVLLYGDINGTRPDDVVRRNGIAYLTGVEAFDDVLDVARDTGLADATTQPDRLGLVEMRNPLRPPPAYTGEIDLLLRHMVDVFEDSMNGLDTLTANGPGADLFDEFKDAQRITLRRAEQLVGLYEYVDRRLDLDQTQRQLSLAAARAALDDAIDIVARREARYRVPVARVAAWRDNPTCYAFTYLWTVHSLHYWWRDEGKAVDAPVSPCYLNIINPASTALGEGLVQDTAQLVRDLTDGGFLSGATECLAAPTTAPTYPQDDLRSRP
jgi:hypothetical protein